MSRETEYDNGSYSSRDRAVAEPRERQLSQAIYGADGGPARASQVQTARCSDRAGLSRTEPKAE